MSDILAILVKTSLLDIAKQASGLGVGLQNVAPDTASQNGSVQYLLSIAESLTHAAADCEHLKTSS